MPWPSIARRSARNLYEINFDEIMQDSNKREREHRQQTNHISLRSARGQEREREREHVNAK